MRRARRAGGIAAIALAVSVWAAAAPPTALPAPKDTWLALRLNARQVVIYFASADSSCGRNGTPLASTYGRELFAPAAIPPAEVAPFFACQRRQGYPPRYPPAAGLRLGQRYRLLLGGRAAVRVRLTRWAVFSGGLEADLGAVATVEPGGRAAYQRSRRNDFLAQAASGHGVKASGSACSALSSPRLTARRRTAIATTLNRVMRKVLPRWRAVEAPYLRNERQPARHERMVRFWRAMDRGLAARRGELRFDVQAVRLAPGAGQTVYRVRALWRVRGQAAGLLTAWLRPGPPVRVIAVDAWPGTWLRLPEMFPTLAAVADARGYCGKVLNVFWLGPGNTAILMLNQGYEDVIENVLLWRPGGPVATALGIADGG